MDDSGAAAGGHDGPVAGVRPTEVRRVLDPYGAAVVRVYDPPLPKRRLSCPMCGALMTPEFPDGSAWTCGCPGRPLLLFRMFGQIEPAPEPPR